MARVIHGEAGGQPLGARLGVAAVIVNRLCAHRFGSSLEAVMLAPGQFQAVGGRLFDLAIPATDRSLARDALERQDPTGGALYFYNPGQTPRHSWIRTRTVLVTIGALSFAR